MGGRENLFVCVPHPLARQEPARLFPPPTHADGRLSLLHDSRERAARETQRQRGWEREQSARAGGGAVSAHRMPSHPAVLSLFSNTQLLIPAEAAHATVASLGRLGVLQFKDLNADRPAFQRTFASHVRFLEEGGRQRGAIGPRPHLPP
jgi:hypothetical protein